MRTKRRQPSEMGVIAIQKQMSSGAGSRKKPRDAIWAEESMVGDRDEIGMRSGCDRGRSWEIADATWTEQTLPQVAIAAISIISG